MDRKVSGRNTRKGDVERWLRLIGPALSGQQVQGGKAMSQKIRIIYYNNFVHYFYSRLWESFSARAAGVADELGNTWKPLAEKTRIYKPLSADERRRYKARKTKRGLLSSQEDKKWKEVFRKRFSYLVNFMPEKEAKIKAAKAAWAIVKEGGARTKKQVLRNRDVDINIRTGRLRKSLSPSKLPSKGMYRPGKDQIANFNMMAGNIDIGTKVPYADQVDKVRPIIPDNYERWVDDANEKAMNAVISYLVSQIK